MAWGHGRGDKEKGGRGDKEKRRRGDKETRRQGEGGNLCETY